MEKQPPDLEYSKLFNKNIFRIKQALWLPFWEWCPYLRTVQRMIPNKCYYGIDGRFYKVNVADYINILQVIYPLSLSGYWKKDPTIGLRSSDSLVSYSEGNQLFIAIGYSPTSSFLVSCNGWDKRIQLNTNGLLFKDTFSQFVVDSYVLLYCKDASL